MMCTGVALNDRLSSPSSQCANAPQEPAAVWTVDELR